MVERAVVNVPGVVVLWCVLEGLKLIAAGVRSECFEVGALVVEAGNATGGGIDNDTQVFVFQSVWSGLGTHFTHL